jgi:hypothetical protein
MLSGGDSTSSGTIGPPVDDSRLKFIPDRQGGSLFYQTGVQQDYLGADCPYRLINPEWHPWPLWRRGI